MSDRGDLMNEDEQDSGSATNYMPNTPRAMVLLKNIEAGGDLVKDTSDLFWLFCTGSKSSEEYKDNMARYQKTIAEQDALGEGGGFTDPEIKNLMYQGFKNPEIAAQAVLDRLDTLSEKAHVAYHPDEPDNPVQLYALTHIESARLFRLLKVEGYTDETRSTLSRALQSFVRCEIAIGNCQNVPWPEPYSVSLNAVASFLYVTQFLLQKSDGAYEEALHSLDKGIYELQGAHLDPIIFSILNKESKVSSTPIIRVPWGAGDIRQFAPWMQSLEPQSAVDCFEALRTGGRIHDAQSLIEACLHLSYVSGVEGWWPGPNQTNEILDSEGDFWDLTDFWHLAVGWIEAQLQPSELRELLQAREDKAAEQRLRTYFFHEKVWISLPERARSSLISADRDLFHSTIARKESILNELQNATEEVLSHGLWKPLDQWAENQDNKQEWVQYFLDFKERELPSKGASPGLRHFEDICTMDITGRFLENRSVADEDRDWFKGMLPDRLRALRKRRNLAEHGSDNQWTTQELHAFLAEFVGIAQRGILPRLARILLLW